MANCSAFIPDLRNSVGGPSSFQRCLVKGFQSRGYDTCYNLNEKQTNAILLINSTRNIGSLLRAKRRGSQIVQRLGNPFPSNSHLRLGFWQRLRVWLGMMSVYLIRSYIADRIVYQSRFVQECWERVHGRVSKPCQIIYNSVDLSLFSPEGPRYVSDADICIISVEGTQPAPVSSSALLLAEALIAKGPSVELLVFGKAGGGSENGWTIYPFVKFMGVTPNQDLPFYYRGASFYILTDIIAACPNSVIESLACGVPVIGYDTSVLPEMLTSQAGRCVPATGDPWRGEPPGNIDGLVHSALEIYAHNDDFRMGARNLAEERYGLERMVDQYISVLFQ